MGKKYKVEKKRKEKKKKGRIIIREKIKVMNDPTLETIRNLLKKRSSLPTNQNVTFI